MYVASTGRNDYVPIIQIAERLDISFHFLTKILQSLTEKQIMVSYRGPKGGIALAKPAGSIRLIDIIEAVDGKDLFTECIFGLPGCGSLVPCPLHGEWERERERIRKMFEGTTLETMADKINDFSLRIGVNFPVRVK